MSQNKSLKKEKFSIDVLMDENLIPKIFNGIPLKEKDKVKRLQLH